MFITNWDFSGIEKISKPEIDFLNKHGLCGEDYYVTIGKVINSPQGKTNLFIYDFLGTSFCGFSYCENSIYVNLTYGGNKQNIKYCRCNIDYDQDALAAYYKSEKTEEDREKLINSAVLTSVKPLRKNNCVLRNCVSVIVQELSKEAIMSEYRDVVERNML